MLASMVLTCPAAKASCFECGTCANSMVLASRFFCFGACCVVSVLQVQFNLFGKSTISMQHAQLGPGHALLAQRAHCTSLMTVEARPHAACCSVHILHSQQQAEAC